MSKTGIVIVGGLALAVIAYQVLERVPSDALNVALGVACGIAASIPVSLGLLIALTRQRQRTELQAGWTDPEPEPVQIVQPPAPRAVPQPAQFAPQTQQLQQPQIIVVTPQGQIIGGQGQFAPGQFQPGTPMPVQWNPQQYPFMQEQANAIDAREWRIIGEE